MNVLLTCAGRRNYLIGYFRQALAGRGEILAADANPAAAALQEADRAFQLPAVADPDYIPRLRSLCRDNGVRLLLSLNDLELPLLALHREQFLADGTIPVVARPEVVDLCFDKWATCRFLQSLGVPVPRTYSSLAQARVALEQGELSFPLVVKPRWGTASIGIDYPHSLKELELTMELGRLRLSRTFLAQVSATDAEHALLIQERLTGEEYGLDVVNDLQGSYQTTFSRRKLSMRCGETDQAVTTAHPALESLGRQLGQALGHVGNLDCDVFVDQDGSIQVLELNPRFGGGYPFSHTAGADVPAALLAWAAGEPAEPAWLRIAPGIAAAKCDRLVETGRPAVTVTASTREESFTAAALVPGAAM
jgi:carbamoyl-phosphate synthase large subunit